MLHSCCRAGTSRARIICRPQPSKGRRATPARQSRAASCYTTASSAAALGHLGAVHKRVSGAKTARSPFRAASMSKEEGPVPDFLRMDQPVSSDPANAKKTGNWHGWPTKDINPVTLTDNEGRTVRIRTPVMDLEGLITPTHLHYTVQHFDVPPVVESAEWELKIVGKVKSPLTLNFDQLRRFPARSVRTVMECSGSDATYFEYFKGEGPKPSRTQEGMILSASEWTGVPLAAVLHEAGLTAKSLYVRAEGNDLGVPPTAAAGHQTLLLRQGSADRKGAPSRHHSGLGAERPDCWSISTAPRCVCWCPAGRATGR